MSYSQDLHETVSANGLAASSGHTAMLGSGESLGGPVVPAPWWASTTETPSDLPEGLRVLPVQTETYHNQNIQLIWVVKVLQNTAFYGADQCYHRGLGSPWHSSVSPTWLPTNHRSKRAVSQSCSWHRPPDREWPWTEQVCVQPGLCSFSTPAGEPGLGDEPFISRLTGKHQAPKQSLQGAQHPEKQTWEGIFPLQHTQMDVLQQHKCVFPTFAEQTTLKRNYISTTNS